MDHPSKHELEARSESPMPALKEYDVLLLGSAEACKYITLSGDEDLVFFPAVFGLWRLPYCVARLAAASTERRKRLPSQLRATETPFPQQTESRQPEPGKPEP
jgi:hypothetical protein